MDKLKVYIKILFVTAVLVVLFFISRTNYLLFHSLVEMFSILIAFSFFIIAWNTSGYHKNNYLTWTGIAYLFVGFIDLIHTLSYKGMSVFTDYDYYANQLWIAARYIESITLTLAFLSLRLNKPVNKSFLFALYSAVTAAILASILHYKIFPECFNDWEGQTRFKIISEYIIMAIIAANIILLYLKKSFFEKRIFNLILASMICTILTEAAFSLYIDNYGFSNMIGHYFKIASFYFMYKAIVETGITEPNSIIFRELNLSRQELKTALDTAEQANTAKGRFIANLSHEIRTPMNAVSGFAGHLLEMENDTKKKEMLGIILDAARHVVRMVNDILDLSKIESGKLPVNQRPFDPRRLISTIVSLLRLQSEEKKIFIRQEIDGSVPQLLDGDEDRIRQMLLNLVQNSVKFTDTGGVTIRAEYNDRIFSVEVTDTGIGIPAEKAALLFKPYEQLHGNISGEIIGTGLGLAITRILANRMNGSVEYKPVPGGGSVFRMEIPLEVGSAAPEFEAVKTHAGVFSPDAELRILAVDDNEVNLMLLSILLGNAGIKFSTSASGEDALNMIRSGSFNLVLLDDIMPGMNGIEILRLMKSDMELSKIKVIMVTANTGGDEIEEYAKAGCDDYISKPVRGDLLIEKIRNLSCIPVFYKPQNSKY